MSGGYDELEEALLDLETLLKNGEIIGELTERGLNASLAMLAVEALAAYLRGDRAAAADDFATVAEEIEARLAVSRLEGGGDPGGGSFGGKPS